MWRRVDGCWVGEYRGGLQPPASAIAVEILAISTVSNPSELTAGIDYFFAVLPDDAARGVIAAVGERFRKSHRVNGVPVGIGDLHLSLCPMGKPERLRQPLEEALLTAGGDVRAQGFTVTLESAMRFSARNGQFPFVLCTDAASSEAALDLRKAIAAAQCRVGLQVSGVSSFLPHVSLLHGHAVDAIEESVAPIQWRVSGFVLIRSFFGQSRYEVVGEWPLAAPPEPEVHDFMDEMANLPDTFDVPDMPDEE